MTQQNNNSNKNNSGGFRHRINFQIRGVQQVRLVDATGKMVGIVPIEEAQKQAEMAGLDLVEMNRNNNPPVCKILDYGKFKYDQTKAQKLARKNQVIQEVKELNLRPVTDTHDLLVKASHVKEWLEEGNKVQIIVKLRGRERAHPEQATEIIKKLLEQVGSYRMDLNPKAEGKNVIAAISPAGGLRSSPVAPEKKG